MPNVLSAMTTDYLKDNDTPRPYLQKIAEAGFSHVHWGHEWNSDFIYVDSEIDRIKTWLKEFNLKVYGVHGSTGKERCWYSSNENQRLAGVELVKNRIRLAGRLDCGTVIMHISMGPQAEEARLVYLAQLHRSLDAVRPYAADFGVRIAIENEIEWDQMVKIKSASPDSIAGDMTLIKDNFDLITGVLADYGPDFLGLCYDAGHGNIGRDRTGRLAPLSERLIAVHLHDNDGSDDQHKLPFEGTVNWDAVTRIIAASPHPKTLCIESQLFKSVVLKDETQFLKLAHQASVTLCKMVESHQQMPVG